MLRSIVIIWVWNLKTICFIWLIQFVNSGESALHGVKRLRGFFFSAFEYCFQNQSHFTSYGFRLFVLCTSRQRFITDEWMKALKSRADLWFNNQSSVTSVTDASTSLTSWRCGIAEFVRANHAPLEIFSIFIPSPVHLFHNHCITLMEANDTSASSNIQAVINGFLLFLVPVGLLSNSFFLAVLLKHPVGSRLTNFLLRTQSAADAVVCLATFLNAVAPSFWSTGLRPLDSFICYFWHCQYVLWHAVSLSVLCLLMTAVDRFMAVEFPQWYATNSRGTRLLAISAACCFIPSALLSIPAFGLVTFYWDVGVCRAEVSAHFKFQSVVIIHCVMWFLLFYAMPSILFVGLYGRVMMVMSRSQGESSSSKRTMRRLTFSCMVITVIFIVSMSYDNIYYVASILWNASYEINSVKQKLGVLLVVVNSCANPFVFFLSMPVFRRTIRQFFPCGSRVQPECSNSSHSFPMSLMQASGRGLWRHLDASVRKRLMTSSSLLKHKIYY